MCFNSNKLLAYRKQSVGGQIDEDVRNLRSPIRHNGRLFNGQILLGPCKVRKQLANLFVCT